MFTIKNQIETYNYQFDYQVSRLMNLVFHNIWYLDTKHDKITSTIRDFNEPYKFLIELP